MARHRKVSVAIWNDEKFRALSDDGELLFLFLLTHPQQTSLGAMRTTMAGLAEERRWHPEKLLKAFAEASHQGMARYDREACCLWLPNFLKYNRPESPNVVRAWASALDLIPECALKLQSVQSAKAILKDYDESFMKAFVKAFPKGVLLAINAPSPNPEQEQEPIPEPIPEPEPHKPLRRAPATENGDGSETEGNPPADDPADYAAWMDVRGAYPPHIHPEADWLIAQRDASQRVAEGERWAVLKAGCERLHVQQRALGNIGGQYVPSPKGMFTKLEKRYLGAFPLPVSPGDRREAAALEQLTARRAEIGLADFRAPRPGETSDQYRAAQDAEWAKLKQSPAPRAVRGLVEELAAQTRITADKGRQ